jgi:hypothetical protein
VSADNINHFKQALVLQPCAYVMGRSVLSSPPAIVPLGEKAGRSLDNEYF